MAFDPVTPNAGDFLRDPIGSWGRLVQVLNYRLDQYNAMGKDIPILYNRIAVLDGTLKALPDSAGRRSVVDQLVRHRQAVDRLVASRKSITGQLLEAMNAVRGEGQRISHALPVVGIGALPIIVGPFVVAVVGVAIYQISQLVREWVAAKAQSESTEVRLLEYAKSANLTPDQIDQVAGSLAKAPKPKGPAGFFGELEAMLPVVAGIAALVIFGPTIAKLVGARSRKAAT